MALLLALLLLAPLPGAASFSLPAGPQVTTHHVGCRQRGAAAFPLAAAADTDADDFDPAGSSDLKSLLPTQKKRTLRLDKFGRRIHDLTDDGTAKFAVGGGSGAVGYSGSGGEGGSSLGSDEAAEAMSSDASVTSELGAGDASVAQSPSLSDMLTGEEGVAARSPKAVAADASTAGFGEVRRSSDLKALLPTRKMRFMKLDKFGRRVQRMEDDGTVHMEKAPTQRRPRASDDDIPVSEAQAAKDDGPVESPSLAKLLGKEDDAPRNDAALGEGKASVDLKELLPKQKMQFMKLDKFGRRVQRMEDDGTVNFAKEPGKATGPKIASHRGTKGGFVGDGAANVDLGSSETASGAANYGSLKQLLPQRPVWTKLDFHGRPVEDERRTKKAANPVDTESIRSGSGLKELLPQRAVWTKLDFHGASVPDERRTKKVDKASSESFNIGTYSNLKTLLPERKIKWRKQGELLSSGSAPTVSENTRGLREERMQAMREEVIASANEGNVAAGDEGAADDDVGSSTEAAKDYTNLKSLLPERKIKWRKTGELLSSGSAPTVSENTRGLREERKQ